MEKLFKNMSAVRIAATIIYILAPITLLALPAVKLDYGTSVYVEHMTSILSGPLVGLGLVGAAGAVLFVWLGEPLLGMLFSLLPFGPFIGAAVFLGRTHDSLKVTLLAGFYIALIIAVIGLALSILLFVKRSMYLEKKAAEKPFEEYFHGKRTLSKEIEIYDQLMRYLNLQRSGIITLEEFEEKKRELLSR